MTKPPPDSSKAPSPGPSRLQRFRELPPWVQGWTAVIGTTIAAVGLVFAAIQVLDRNPASTPIVVVPDATIVAMIPGDGIIDAEGTFTYVDVGAEKVYLVGRPANAPTEVRYLPAVEARFTAGTTGAAGARVDGAWAATIPVSSDDRIKWWAVVMSAAAGAGGGLEDLRVNGPASSLVLGASEPFETGE